VLISAPMSDQDKNDKAGAAPKPAAKTGGRGARFGAAMDVAAAALNASVDFDKRLLRDDVRGSQAHARMLAAVGLISADDAKQIVAGLDKVAGEFERGERTMDPALEDVHMNVENRLIELIGDAGRRLHTARSRNDQVATDMRLFALSSASAIVVAIDKARVAICRRAREHAATLLPGYTHLQRAQAITLGHHLLAYAEMLSRDRGRFLDAARRASECPLGSGALAATSLPIDREATSASLGFAAPTRNSLDAVSDRDFCAELAFACALLGVHLSRLGEELVLWSTTEFGFVRLGEGHCSGSSLMPQKRNPDIAELMRAKPGRLIGDLVALLTSARAWPWPTTRICRKPKSRSTTPSKPRAGARCAAAPHRWLGIQSRTHEGSRQRSGSRRDRSGRTPGSRRRPFRKAHEIVGKLVRHAEQLGVSLRDVPEHDLPQIAPELHAASLQVLSPARAVAGRAIIGGPAPRKSCARCSAWPPSSRAWATRCRRRQ
jgi:argininosuccinate lyase